MHGNDAGLADFMAGWDWVNTSERVTATSAVIGLTNFGERPVESTRLAEVLDVPVDEAEARARQWGWPGTRVEDGLIIVQIGDRRFGVTGCAGDIFYYTPLVRPSLQVEETCPVTGTLIRIVFIPSGVGHVDHAGAVMPMPDPNDDLTVHVQGGRRRGDRCQRLRERAPLLFRRGGSKMGRRPPRQPRLPDQAGMGPEHLSRLAGPNVGRAESPRLITGQPSGQTRRVSPC